MNRQRHPSGDEILDAKTARGCGVAMLKIAAHLGVILDQYSH